MNSGGPELTKEVLEHVSALSNDVNDMSFELKEQKNKVIVALNDIQLILKRLQALERNQETFEQRITKLEQEGVNKGTYISLGIQIYKNKIKTNSSIDRAKPFHARKYKKYKVTGFHTISIENNLNDDP